MLELWTIAEERSCLGLDHLSSRVRTRTAVGLRDPVVSLYSASHSGCSSSKNDLQKIMPKYPTSALMTWKLRVVAATVEWYYQVIIILWGVINRLVTIVKLLAQNVATFRELRQCCRRSNFISRLYFTPSLIYQFKSYWTGCVLSNTSQFQM